LSLNAFRMRSTSSSRWRAEASRLRSLSISASVADVGGGGLEDDAVDVDMGAWQKHWQAREAASAGMPFLQLRPLSRTSTNAPKSRPPPRRRDDVYKERNRNLLMYSSAVVRLLSAHLSFFSLCPQIIATLGITYASVPLYRMFCAATGFAGTPNVGTGRFEAERLVPLEGAHRIKVHFNADRAESLPWSFTPQQRFVTVLPGETSLAFYTAKNNSKQDIIGIATYNVTPDRVRFSRRFGIISTYTTPGRSVFLQGRVFLLRRAETASRRRSRHAPPVLHRQGHLG
jgi:hypothetical protein